MVASPIPTEIVELDSVKRLFDSTIVITCGGGGIPVVRKEDGDLEGVAAVIDKDFAAELLAENIGADALMILTEVEKVAINFNKPNQENLGHPLQTPFYHKTVLFALVLFFILFFRMVIL